MWKTWTYDLQYARVIKKKALFFGLDNLGINELGGYRMMIAPKGPRALGDIEILRSSAALGDLAEAATLLGIQVVCLLSTPQKLRKNISYRIYQTTAWY